MYDRLLKKILTSIFPLPQPATIRFPLQAKHQIGEGDNSRLESAVVTSPEVKQNVNVNKQSTPNICRQV